MVERRKSAITGAQIRAARGLLNLTAEALADETKLSLKTIRRAEQEHGQVQINAANAERIVSVLEACGVNFIPLGEGGVGVRLRLNPPPQFRTSTVRRSANKSTAKSRGSERKP